MNDAVIQQYWQAFLNTLPPDSAYRAKSYMVDKFGDHPALANELGELVANGTKTGTCSAVWEWEAEGNPIPAVGLISMTLNGADEPICIIETTEVTIRNYNEVDAEFARSEGEGDLSLEYWRDAHRRYFSRVLPKIGREFSVDMPLVCERFRLLYR